MRFWGLGEAEGRRIIWAHQFSSSSQDQSTVAQWAVMTVDERSLMKNSLRAVINMNHGSENNWKLLILHQSQCPKTRTPFVIFSRILTWPPTLFPVVWPHRVGERPRCVRRYTWTRSGVLRWLLLSTVFHMLHSTVFLKYLITVLYPIVLYTALM